MPADEEVLVIPAAVCPEFPGGFGTLAGDENSLADLLCSPNLSFRRRDHVETDPSFKQLIPYAVLCHGDWVFAYQRGKAGGESRLHHKWSIGIGGHISRQDGDDWSNAYHSGFARELAEEVRLGSAYTAEVVGLIYDPRTAVGQVHLGVVHRLELSAPKVQSNEESISSAGFVHASELRQRFEQFESWSQLCWPLLRIRE